MAALRFTKAEREFIRKILTPLPPEWKVGELKLADSILDKLEKSELVRGTGRAPGLPYPAILAAFRAGLGDRLLNPMGATVARLCARVRELGLSIDDCTAIAVSAAKRWRGPVKAISLVNNAELLLSAPLPDETTPSGAPMEMEDL